MKLKSLCQDADALHKYAAGNRYPEKSDVLDVCGSGGFVRVTGIISVAAVLYVSWHVGLFYLNPRLFFGKTHCRSLSAILYIFEWLFYCFFAPIIEKRGTTQNIETVVLGDHTLTVLDILNVQAMEHRVCIRTKHGDLVERSRFHDLMQILNYIDCVQPHRSYWVPTHAIMHLEGDADRLNIVLSSGDKIAVARTRRSEIEDWAKEKTLLIRALD